MPTQPSLNLIPTIQQAIMSLLLTYEPVFLQFGYTLFISFATILIAWHGIHMMFMRFPIDAIFVGKRDADGVCQVVSVNRGLRAWIGLVPLVLGAHGVLELPVGTIDRTETQVGDTLRLAPGSITG